MIKWFVNKYFMFLKRIAYIGATSVSYLGFYEHKCPKELENLKNK